LITLSPPPIPENYKKTSNPIKLRFPKPNYEGNNIIILKIPKDKKLTRTFPNRFYYYFITIEQAGPIVIRIDNTDSRKQITIK